MTHEAAKLTKFKYVPEKDTGINADKQKVLYNIVFPAGKEVEVPNDLVHKLRTKEEFVEVHATVDKTEAELQKEKDARQAEKDAKAAPEKLTPERLAELQKLAQAEEARVAKLQNDAKLGR
jgi:hypothetical protein